MIGVMMPPALSATPRRLATVTGGPAPGSALMPRPLAPAKRCLVGSCRRLLAPAACHEHAELLLGRGGRQLGDDLALVDHERAIAERAYLLELERDQQDRAALVALLDQASVHELDRADVEAARGLGGDQHLGVGGQLAGDDHLLLVAAGQR